MARFDIISKDGKTIRYSGKPRYCGSYLKPSFLEFSEMAYPTPIAWEVGDYVDYPRTGMRYRLYSIPQASKNARKGSYGGAFAYSNVQFHAATKELEIALFRDLVANDNNIHFSTSPDVATYENVEGIARRIQACMDDLYPGRWEIRIAEFDAVADAEVIEKIATAKNFALSGGTCLDALSKIYELWEDIGWIHTYENGKEVITIGYANRRIDANTTDAYLYGKGNGLTAIKKNQTNKDEFATRLYVYGSERNLPHRYYNGKDILNAESVDIRNLMLPLDKWGLTDGLPDARKAYLENAEAVAKYGVIPKIHYFDSDDAGADIYPSIEGMTVGQLRKVLADMGETKYSPDASIYPDDSERVDEVWGSPKMVDDGVLKRSGKEHDIEYGQYIFAVTTPKTTIPKGTAEKTAVVENLIIKDIELDAQGIVRAKITFTSEKTCTIADAGYESVSGVLTLANSLDSPSIKEEVGFTFVLNEEGVWEGRLPKVVANYDKLSYMKYVAFASMSVYVTPKQALASDITASVNISDGYVTFIADQLFDKTFQLTLKQIGFDINERAAMGEGKVISMKTGMCAGRNFVISECRYVANVDRWVLICRRQQDDTLGMLFPNKDYQIATDDQFVLLDIALPEVYIGVAQERLLAEGERLLAKASKIQSHYEPMIDAKVMIESGRTLREGMFMEISDEDVIDNGTDYILIDTLSIYEDESAIPTYKVTLREKRKVTYKGTPSATSETSTKSYGEDQTVNADIDLSDYATKDYVDNAIGNITPGGGGSSVDIEGSEFVKVSSSGKISLEIDSQGGLGNTGQGLGIVDIPSNLLEGNVYNVYYTENNELTSEQLEANGKAYAALMSEEKAAFYLVQEGNVYSRLIVSTTMKSASAEAIAVEAHVIVPTGNKTMLGTTAINLYSDGHISMTVVQSNLLTEDEVNAALEQKQDILVDGQNIKTINGQSILGEGDIVIQGGGGAEVRALFVNDAGLSADELSYNAETVQLIFAQHPMIFFVSAEEGTPLSEYELMGMDNGRMVFAKYELNEFSTGATYIYLAMDGSTEVGGFSKSELDGDKYDQYLDANSTNAVQNKVVTENIRALEAAMPLMAAIDLDTIIAQDTPIDNATRNALLELGGYTAGDKYFSKGWIWSRVYLYTIKVIPTDAGVQIHVLSLKGWCEILEDNSKVNHLPSQGGGSIEVDAELSEVSENAVGNKAVTMALAETEEVTAAALNELNERFEEYATKEDLEDALADVSIEVDSAMSDTSENAVSNKVIKKYVDDADKVIKKYVDDADKSVKEYVDDADNALAERINALEQNSGGSNVEVDSELSESSTNAIANKAVTEAIVEDEEVVAVALNEINTRFDGYAPLDGLASEIQNAKDAIDASIIDNEEVAAAALVDLDKRLKDIIKILSNAGLM